jgi:hypothetical protein
MIIKMIFIITVLECALTLARDLAYIWPRCPHQYYLCAIPPSLLRFDRANLLLQKGITVFLTLNYWPYCHDIYLSGDRSLG